MFPHLYAALHAAGAAQQDGAGESTAVADVAAIRSGLQKKAAGKWALKYVCSHASKCSCPYALEFRHAAGSQVVSVWQMAPHHFHDPTNADETTAATRDALLYVSRAMADLPEESKQALLQKALDLRSTAEEMRKAERLEPIKVRAAKQARRKRGRSEEDRLARALLTRNHTSSVPLAQQTAAAEPSDPLPTLAT